MNIYHTFLFILLTMGHTILPMNTGTDSIWTMKESFNKFALAHKKLIVRDLLYQIYHTYDKSEIDSFIDNICSPQSSAPIHHIDLTQETPRVTPYAPAPSEQPSSSGSLSSLTPSSYSSAPIGLDNPTLNSHNEAINVAHPELQSPASPIQQQKKRARKMSTTDKQNSAQKQEIAPLTFHDHNEKAREGYKVPHTEYVCDIPGCPAFFNSTIDLYNHQLESHNNIPAVYPEPAVSLLSKQTNAKKNTSYEYSLVNHRCKQPNCTAFFDTAEKLSRHLKKEHGIEDGTKKLKCPYPGCSVHCVSEGTLNKHIEKKHANDHHKLLLCDTCNLNFSTQDERITHTTSYHSLNKHVCYVCNKSYQDRAGLNRHFLGKHFSLKHPVKQDIIPSSTEAVQD